jgi:PadR family transcriptional regulator, regulatory protein AphA
MDLSKTAYVVLGMLNLGHRTGYEIKSLVDLSTRFFWAASYGQIYPELSRLEAQGLVSGEREEHGGRRRKAYELTADGERALHEWLTSQAPLHFELRHEGILKLFFAEALEAEQRVALLEHIRAEHERVREQLLRVHAAKGAERDAAAGGTGDDHSPMPLEVLEWGIEYQDFVVDWCARLERKLAVRTTSSGRS